MKIFGFHIPHLIENDCKCVSDAQNFKYRCDTTREIWLTMNENEATELPLIDIIMNSTMNVRE